MGSFTFPNCGPSLLLRLNGDAGDVVRVPPGTFEVTLAGENGDSVAPMDWYYAVVLGGSVYWLTPGGSSLAATPLLTGVPPADFPDTAVWTTPLPVRDHRHLRALPARGRQPEGRRLHHRRRLIGVS